MPQERSDAVVLRAVDFSETSRIVTVLTPHRGKMALLATGVRRPKSELAALLDTFNRVELVYYWKDSRSVQRLGEASLHASYPGVKRDLDKQAFAGVGLEFVYKVAHENEPSAELFGALTTGLASLETWTGSAQAHGAWLLMRLLAAAGFEPALDGPAGSVRFDYGSGVTTGAGDTRLDAADADALRRMAASPADCPEAALSPGGFLALARFAERQAESHFRSLRVLAQMY